MNKEPASMTPSQPKSGEMSDSKADAKAVLSVGRSSSEDLPPATPTLHTHTLRDLNGLDPVTLHISDVAPGQGKLTIECYGCAWSCWWGSMGGGNVLRFIASCDSGYLANCLIRGRRQFITSRSGEQQEMKYLTRICEALIGFAKASEAA